ncbi:uncharacterized protein LOC135835282 [Planococcus citri]|uniref:uncharacterized protein LOC135835282 n=1 Tax=Planococcus citri TaxID=170843 RepID=UPI0031F89AF2
MPAFIQYLILLLISINTIVHCREPFLFTEDILEKSHGKIIFSSVIFRHGDRSPTKLYPNDPYSNEKYWQMCWPQGDAQLSKIGKLQEYNLGKWFRKRYNSLIPNGYRYDLLIAESSNLDRTIMSAECFLAGFLPPSSSETWADDGLKWQPVSVRAIPLELDNIFRFGIKCERYNLEEDQFNKSPHALDFYLTHQKLLNYIAAKSGYNMSSDNVLKIIHDASELHQALFIEQSCNLTLPEWTDSIYPEPLIRFASLGFLVQAYSLQMRRIRVGPLLGKLIQEMEMKIQGKLNATFHFYSAHDTTIAVLLTALEMYQDIFILPPYSSSVIIELRQHNGNNIVTILYRNSTTAPPQLLYLRGCDHVCTLDKFKTLTQHIIPENWHDECDASLVKEKNERNNIIFQEIINSLGLNVETRQMETNNYFNLPICRECNSKMAASILFLLLLSISNNIIVYCEEPLLFTEDSLKNSHGNVIFSSVLFRHGDRSPYVFYPNDPYNHELYFQKYWPDGIGQLTKVGKLQEYNLGKWFRKRYDSLIPQGYRYDLLKIESSDLDRTIMSAQCFLAGFFPPSISETWADDDLKWQPVPIRAIPLELDNIIGFRGTCNSYILEKDRFNKSPEAQNFYLMHQKLFKYIAANSGYNMSPDNILQTIENAYVLYDTLFVEKSHNLKLSEWTERIYPEPLKQFGSLGFLMAAYSHHMRRIKTGPFIDQLVKGMEMKIQKKLNATFHFYSGHDTTIASLLTALEMYKDIFILPPYSSSLIFELRQKDEDHSVTILYRNSTTTPPKLLRLRGCDHVCTLDRFKTLTQHLIPENWNDECDASSVKKEDSRNTSFQEMITLLGLNKETT